VTLLLAPSQSAGTDAGNLGGQGKAETVIEFVDATGAARDMEQAQRKKKLVRAFPTMLQSTR